FLPSRSVLDKGRVVPYRQNIEPHTSAPRSSRPVVHEAAAAEDLPRVPARRIAINIAKLPGLKGPQIREGRPVDPLLLTRNRSHFVMLFLQRIVRHQRGCVWVRLHAIMGCDILCQNTPRALGFAIIETAR